MRRALAVVLILGSFAGERAARAALWPSAEKRVERALADADVAVRRQGALELGTLPPSAARRLSAPALADADVEVRLAALAVAVRLGEKELGARLSAWLSDPDARLRLAAAEALTTRASERALPALGRASSDADPRVRAAVARALGASASPEAVLPLLGRLDDAVPDVRREVVTALGELGDRRAVVPLLGKVQDPAGAVRRAAARALGRLGDPRAGSALVLVLRDSDPEVRTAALEAVGRLRDANAVWSVVATLADGEPGVRAAAAVALARLATPAALAALLTELDREGADPEPVVTALELAGPVALPLLRACVETTAARGRVEGCARALGALGDESDVARLRGALAAGTVPPLVALPVLASLGGAAAVPAVLEFLASPDAAVRHAAAFALAELIDPAHPDGRAVDPLLQAFRARSATLAERALLVRLLGRTGEARVGPELERVARETTAPALASSALLALGDLGPGAWEPTLLAQLDADDGSVRMAAALALRRSATPSAFAALLDRFEHGAEQDRLALGVALPGAARRARDAREAKRLVALLARAGDERDALLETWAAFGAEPRLAEHDFDASDRRKLAEVLAVRAHDDVRLAALGRDSDAAVRANAAWSFGQATTPAALEELTRLLADRDPRVAANAAVSVGRLGRRLGRDTAPLLCPLTNDARSSVRADAAAALGVAGLGCGPGVLERLLAADPSPRVRRAVARALGRASRTPALDAALERCAAEDANGDVAAECRRRTTAAPAHDTPVLVFVVPTGAAAPTPGAPFVLRLSDGTERFGVADRRGAIFEPHAPAGAVELGVLPAAGE